MPVISSPGVGSGLDIATLVQNLVAAERTPAQLRLAGQEARLQSQLSGVGVLRAALAEFADVLGALDAPLVPPRAASGDPAVLGASAAGTAVAGVYQVQVEQLAAAQTLRSGAYASAQTVVGDGTLTLGVGTQVADLVFAPGAGTLEAIRDAINAARDSAGNPLPVTASLITSSGGPEPAGTYLVVRATQTGLAGAVTLSASGGDGGLAALTFPGALVEQTPARNARLRIDGLAVEAPTNTLDSAIAGLTLTAVAPGTAQVTVAPAPDAGVGALRGVVEAYNRLNTAARALGHFDPAGNHGALLGDAALRGLASALRQALGAERIPGLGTQADGSLKLDAAAFGAALTADPDGIAALLQGESGLAARLRAAARAHGDGSLAARGAGIERRLDDIADARDALETRMDALEARYRAQFGALDRLLGQLQATSGFLTQQLDALAGLRPSAGS